MTPSQNRKPFLRRCTVTLIGVLTLWLVCFSSYGLQFKQECGRLSDAVINTQPSVLLSGGADAKSPDEKKATQWFINQAKGGDYLVIRSNGLGKQAKWICQHFRNHINSAAEISIDSIEDASHPAVVELIESVEIIWIAGGDQSRYHRFWSGTPLAKALNLHIKTKAIGGTSAGMAILGGAYYAPSATAITGQQLLQNPFHQNSQDILEPGLLQHPYLHNTLNETHLDRILKGETRSSRAFGFLARLSQSAQSARVIALNEGSFLGINPEGKGAVWGNGGYLLTTNTQPEQMSRDQPLIWLRGHRAVTAYKLHRSSQIQQTLDFRIGVFSGFDVEYWYTTQGRQGFNRVPHEAGH